MSVTGLKLELIVIILIFNVLDTEFFNRRASIINGRHEGKYYISKTCQYFDLDLDIFSRRRFVQRKFLLIFDLVIFCYFGDLSGDEILPAVL